MYRGLGSRLHNFREIIILYTIVVGMRESCVPEVFLDPILFDTKTNRVEPKSEIAHKSQTRKKNSAGPQASKYCCDQ